MDRSVPPPTYGNASSASLPQPIDVVTIYSPSSTSCTSDRHVCTTAPRARLHSAPPPQPGLEGQAHLSSSHGIPVKAAPVRLVLHTPTSVPSLQPHVSATQMGTHPVRSATTGKRSAGTGPFPKPRALVLPVVKFGQSKPDGLGHIDTADSDLMHHQYRLSVLQWNPGPARRNPTNIIAATCGRFHAFIFQQASDHVTPHLRSVHCVHWQHGPRHLAQQGHLRAGPCGSCLQGRLHKQRYLEHGATHRSRPAAPPLTFRDTNGHILLCAHSQCRCQET